MRLVAFLILISLTTVIVSSESMGGAVAMKTIELKNSSFEESGTPGGWTAHPDIKVDKKSGVDNSACLIMPESNTGRYYVFQRVAVREKGVYILSVSAKTDKKAFARIGVFEGKRLAEISDSRKINHNWERISLAFYKNDDTAVSYNIFLSGYVPCGNVMWDNVRLEFHGENMAPEKDGCRIENLWSLFKSGPDSAKFPGMLSRENVVCRHAFPEPSPTVPGELYLERPTHNCIGFEWFISGDYNRNGGVKVEYRKSGDQKWLAALPMHRNMFEVSGQAYIIARSGNPDTKIDFF